MLCITHMIVSHSRNLYIQDMQLYLLYYSKVISMADFIFKKDVPKPAQPAPEPAAAKTFYRCDACNYRFSRGPNFTEVRKCPMCGKETVIMVK